MKRIFLISCVCCLVLTACVYNSGADTSKSDKDTGTTTTTPTPPPAPAGMAEIIKGRDTSQHTPEITVVPSSSLTDTNKYKVRSLHNDVRLERHFVDTTSAH